MKKLIVFILVSFFLLSCSRQVHVNNFYKEYQQKENSMYMKMPMFFAKLLAKDIASSALLDGIKDIQFLTLTDLEDDERNAIQAEYSRALSADGFQSWFSVNNDGRTVQVNSIQRGNKTKNLVFSLESNDRLIFIKAKTNLSETQIIPLIEKIQTQLE